MRLDLATSLSLQFLQKGEYDNAKPYNYVEGNSDCTDAELAYIDAGLAAALPALRWSLANENSYLFKKWFGEEVETDEDVRWVLNEATAWMSRRGSHWNPLCCKSSAGACGSCQAGSGTQAFVTASYQLSDPSYTYNNTWVRLCTAMMDSAPEQVGFIMFHELVHVVSQVVDSQMGYGKGPLVQLANNSPNAARSSANNYMLYAAQNGLSFEDYNALSGGWGANAFDPNCMDNWTVCTDMAKNCCGNTTLSIDCCASCMIFDSTNVCKEKNYPYVPGHGLVFDPEQPGLGLINNPNPPTVVPEIPEELCAAANGILGCGSECGNSCDCFTNMTCSNGVCVDVATQSTQGASCNAWDNEHGLQEAAGSKGCGDQCAHSDECKAELFCCPNWSMCMDRATFSSIGPNCTGDHYWEGPDAADEAPAPDAPVKPRDPLQGCNGTEYCEIGEMGECANNSKSIQLQEVESTISGCYQMCLDRGDCHYFLRDQNDGECRGYTDIAVGECEAPYRNSVWYMLYQVNYEPENSGMSPGTNGIALLLNAKTACMATSFFLGWAVKGDAQSCADLCLAVEGCEFFHFDPNDGECASVATAGPNCPENTRPSYYDFYAANGGSEPAVAGEEKEEVIEEKTNLRMIAEGQKCDQPRGVHFGNVATNSPEACGVKCSEQPMCKHFNYDPISGECIQVEPATENCEGGLQCSRLYDFWGI